MTLTEMAKAGYAIKAWTVSTVKGERHITLHLSKKGQAYITSTPLGLEMLKDSEFIKPIKVGEA